MFLKEAKNVPACSTLFLMFQCSNRRNALFEGKFLFFFNFYHGEGNYNAERDSYRWPGGEVKTQNLKLCTDGTVSYLPDSKEINSNSNPREAF